MSLRELAFNATLLIAVCSPALAETIVDKDHQNP
jgi:hypothetical protein